MKKIVILVCVILSLGYGETGISQDLPDDMLADQYLLEATKAMENGKPQIAIQALGKIEALNTDPPLEFLFFHGKLLVEHGTTLDDMQKGQALLKQFVINAGKDSERYRPTLELLSVVGAKLEEAEEAKRQRQAKFKQFSDRLKKQMVHVPGGRFNMGCTREQRDCDDDEQPVHGVQVNDFEIGQHEVTQEAWAAVMGENPSQHKCLQCPVENVSWEDVQKFLDELNARTGGEYRLPTEAEWEYASRGGQQSRGYHYAGGNNLDAVAWYWENSGEETHPVGQKEPNELGLYDMSGNVWEWVEDCWHEDYRGAPVDGRAWESENSGDCSRRVLRGGSWFSTPGGTSAPRTAAGTSSGLRYSYVGFRLALTLTP